jgi:hypothetical protein
MFPLRTLMRGRRVLTVLDHDVFRSDGDEENDEWHSQDQSAGSMPSAAAASSSAFRLQSAGAGSGGAGKAASAGSGSMVHGISKKQFDTIPAHLQCLWNNAIDEMFSTSTVQIRAVRFSIEHNDDDKKDSTCFAEDAQTIEHMGLVCKICTLASNCFYSTTCGHPVCFACKPNLKMAGDGCECPTCRHVGDWTACYDTKTRFAGLHYKCGNAGCDKKAISMGLTFAAVKEHILSCKFRDLDCEYCGEIFAHSDHKEHQEWCRDNKTCEFCGKDVDRKTAAEQHDRSGLTTVVVYCNVTRRTVPVSNSDSTLVSALSRPCVLFGSQSSGSLPCASYGICQNVGCKLAEHVNGGYGILLESDREAHASVCDNEVTSCPIACCNCNWRGPRKDLYKHVADAGSEHLSALACAAYHAVTQDVDQCRSMVYNALKIVWSPKWPLAVRGPASDDDDTNESSKKKERKKKTNGQRSTEQSRAESGRDRQEGKSADASTGADSGSSSGAGLGSSRKRKHQGDDEKEEEDETKRESKRPRHRTNGPGISTDKEPR